jgi:hypothetical protein
MPDPNPAAARKAMSWNAVAAPAIATFAPA